MKQSLHIWKLKDKFVHFQISKHEDMTGATEIDVINTGSMQK